MILIILLHYNCQITCLKFTLNIVTSCLSVETDWASLSSRSRAIAVWVAH